MCAGDVKAACALHLRTLRRARAAFERHSRSRRRPRPAFASSAIADNIPSCVRRRPRRSRRPPAFADACAFPATNRSRIATRCWPRSPAAGRGSANDPMIYTHVLGLGASGLRSPLDALGAAEDVLPSRERRINSRDHRPPAASSFRMACYDRFAREPFARYSSACSIGGRGGRGSILSWAAAHQRPAETGVP